MTQPPENSVFKLEETFEGRKITIPRPKRNLSDLGRMLFPLFWLCGWAIGEYIAIGAILGMSWHSIGGWFLAAWLGGWTVGGAMAMAEVYKIAKGEPPEIIILGNLELKHQKKKQHAYQKDKIGKIELENTNRSQCLYFDYGADRIFIGEHIREQEREWLFSQIRAWKTA